MQGMQQTGIHFQKSFWSLINTDRTVLLLNNFGNHWKEHSILGVPTPFSPSPYPNFTVTMGKTWGKIDNLETKCGHQFYSIEGLLLYHAIANS